MYAFVNKQMKVLIEKADINICSAIVPASCRLTDCAVEDVFQNKRKRIAPGIRRN